MRIRHLQPDTPRRPLRVAPEQRAELVLATSPVAPDQTVWIEVREQEPTNAVHAPGVPPGADSASYRIQARWVRNDGDTSYWRAHLGPFRDGTRVSYRARAASPTGDAETPSATFRVGARLHLALMWHQHQPLYRDPTVPIGPGAYQQPWVRLHGIRDYYAMAHLVQDHPRIHATFNLTPVLLEQLEDYLERGATDRALELTTTPAERLDETCSEEVQATFFDADWHHQIYPHPRYRELLDMRRRGAPFDAQALRDLQMWFSLAWFAPEFRSGTVDLPDGATASVRALVDQGRDFDHAQIEAMVAEQYKILRAIVPLHRTLQDRGQIEVSTSPYYHPILPLLIDTDRATIDRPGTEHPRRFAYPSDARAQVRTAVDAYERHFGRPPRGMWPAEGAVSPDAVALLAEEGVRWAASDAGVLARSGRWGYETDDPNVLCRPYRLETPVGPIRLFFRDTALSNEIGFHYHAYEDPEAAAADFLRQVRERFADRIDDADRDHVLTVILDGENAWSAYPEEARPFLHALYGALERARDIATVTFSECLDGDADTGRAHDPAEAQPRLHDLFTASWIDEPGSAPGVDLGTWIGEPAENAAWELLRAARDAIEASGATPESHPRAYAALYAAEGSDWFWWLGDTQDSGHDGEFEALFRAHLARAYLEAGLPRPEALADRLVEPTTVWTFTRPVRTLAIGTRLTVRTNCPGGLRWRSAGGPLTTTRLVPVGGAMAGARHHEATLGPFHEPGQVRFTFLCTFDGCSRVDVCCHPEERSVLVTANDR